MRAHIPRFRETSLYPPLRGVRQLLLRLFSNRFVPRNRVRRIRLGTRDYKRVRLGDVWTANRVADGLRLFESTGSFPRLEAQFEDELLIEFVPGTHLAGFDAAAGPAVAAFFANLYRPTLQADARRPLAETRFAGEARRDLRFLHDVGIVDAERRRALECALDALSPAEVYVGWDYTDSIPKNFVTRLDGTLVGIDAEALHPDVLLGTGIAKSLARGDADYRTSFFAAFAAESTLSLEPSLPFAELCFHLGWQKRLYLKGSKKRLEPEVLERFLAHGRTGGPRTIAPPGTRAGAGV